MKKIILCLLLTACLNVSAAYSNEPDKILSTFNEAVSYCNTKQYNKAIPLLTHILNEYESEKPSNIDDYAGVCYMLGSVYHDMGNLAEAEHIYNKGLTALLNHPEDVEGLVSARSILCGIGLVYYELRNYAEAEEYLAYSKYLYEKNLDMDLAYSKCLNNLALVSIALNKHLWAKCYLDVSVDICSKSTQMTNSQVATSYSNLAVIYEQLGYLDEAETYINKAITICEQNAITHELPQILNNLGTLHWKKGELDMAQECFEKAYKQSDSSYPNHALMGLNLVGSQHLNEDKNFVASAKTLSHEVTDDIIGKFAFLPNSLRERYWIWSSAYLQCCNAYLFTTRNPKNYGTVYDNTLFSKGLLLRTSNWISSRIRSADETSRLQLAELIDLQSQVASGLVAPDSVLIVKYRIDNLDKELTRNNADYAAFKDDFIFDWRKIKTSLGQEEAAVEFIKMPEIAGDSVVRTLYAAIVITQKSKTPDIITLCEEQQLQSIFAEDITTLSASGRKSKLSEYIRKLYSNGNPRLYKGEEVYSLIWAPLEKAMENISTVYYSPSGLLHSVAFQAISHENIPLCDRYNMHLLSSTSEIVRLKKEGSTTIGKATVYGGIRYDASDEELLAEARSYSHSHSSVWSCDDNETRAGWGYLVGTEKESQDVHARLSTNGVPADLLSGTKANEESFKSFDGNSPSLIHLATHGFFLSDPKAIAQNLFIQRKEENIQTNDNLLNRSGLLFAGANRAWMARDVIDGIEDGILTADEISRLNLSNTELVVLSACETGLGEVVATEGVFGLQRAFKLAGVKSMIMSLWKVPDEATSKLMQLFYENWLNGTEMHQAFAVAQKQIRTEYPSPYYWAGFVILD